MANFREKLAGVKAFIFDIDGVLSTQTITMSSMGVPLRSVNLRDGYALQLAVKKGFIVAVISGGNSREYRKRMKTLGVTEVYLNSKSKIEHYNSLKKKFALSDEEVLYMGDDIPDLEVMRTVGIPVCPADADHEIKESSLYISDRNGGEGCVRDVVEQALRLRKMWLDNDAFTW